MCDARWHEPSCPQWTQWTAGWLTDSLTEHKKTFLSVARGDIPEPLWPHETLRPDRNWHPKQIAILQQELCNFGWNFRLKYNVQTNTCSLVRVYSGLLLPYLKATLLQNSTSSLAVHKPAPAPCRCQHHLRRRLLHVVEELLLGRPTDRRHPCHGQRAAVNHEILLLSGFLGRADCVSNALHRRRIPMTELRRDGWVPRGHLCRH